MKKLILLSLIIILSGVVYFYTHSRYLFKYFASPDSKYSITRVIRQSHSNYEVYYTYGRFIKKEIPKQYIRPESVWGLDEGYDFIINWQDSICTIHTCYGEYEKVGLSTVFRFQRNSCNLNDTIWHKMINDTIHNFQEISSELPAPTRHIF